ncbi:hypothetical protein BHYA_0193g00140 [Botrytis hyacinthi]|uniref:Uncharacterized protein n=1 Tax=Botrytis hyacinthi TaxID=278943 RepID=A0A4Z1GGK5_9HELO|nr:hypothetical protein BHYA_0193g00140 [Botrytis hyacinthi]
MEKEKENVSSPPRNLIQIRQRDLESELKRGKEKRGEEQRGKKEKSKLIKINSKIMDLLVYGNLGSI